MRLGNRGGRTRFKPGRTSMERVMAEQGQDRTYWNDTAGEGPHFPSLQGDVEVDVAIVGGGIVGVTTARLLKDRGLTVALVEARRVGRQVTGKSTAKMSSQHGIH